MRRSDPRVLAALALSALAACGAASRRLGSASSGDLWPLAAGDAWSHEVAVEGAPPTLVVTRVLAVRNGEVTMTAGGEPYRYRLGRGVIERPGGAILLRWPARRGDRWTVPGGVAEVTATDAVVEVPAGRYRGCVVVEERRSDAVVRTAYAPGVGPARVEVDELGPSGAARRVALSVLRGYAPAGPRP